MLNRILLIFALINVSHLVICQNVNIPVDIYNRTEISLIKLTKIGMFGELRKERPGIPAHYHTGIDIMRPNPNFENEPIFSIAEGIVISVRDDGPFAQIIIEHSNNGNLFWSEYEHVAGIKVSVGDNVFENTVIARFMNKFELNKYGWQFNHFHLEILKQEPVQIIPNKNQPQHLFNTYNLTCYTLDELNFYYYNPLDFFNNHLN